MPNIGFQEIILILIIALLFFGPKKLPEIGKSLGQGLREFKKISNDLAASMHSVDDEIKTAINDDIEEEKKEDESKKPDQDIESV